MRLNRWTSMAAAVGLAAAAGSACAANCYTVLDRSDNVIYRGTISPVDLSDAGKAERDAMRRRGEHLIIADTDRCPGVEFFTGSAGSATLNVDQIVGGITPMRGRTPTGTTVPFPSATDSAPKAPGPANKN